MDDVKHANDDLFETSTDGDDVSTTQQTTATADESDELLGDKPSEKAQQQFIDSWAKKIKSGEKTLDDLAAQQKWLLPKVKEQLENSSETPKENMRELVREEAKKLLDEERSKQSAEQDKAKFDEFYGNLKKMSLTQEQRKIINEKYKLLSDKLDPYEALKVAAEIAQVDFEQTDAKRRAMPSMRMGQGAILDQELDLEKMDPNTMSKEQRYKYVSGRMSRR